MKYPRITIVTPSFNKGDFLSRTIESVVKQKYPNLEYLIMDAGSEDNSREIIKGYAARYPEIKYIFGKDRGQWDAVNIGFHKASGDLLGFLNADDLYTENSFRQLAKAYSQNPSGIWYAGKSRIIDDHGKPKYGLVSAYKDLLLKINQKVLLQIVNYLMQPSVFITRRAFAGVGDFMGEGKYILEYDYWLRLSNIGMPVVVPDYLSTFRMSPEMASLKFSERMLAADNKAVSAHTGNKIVLSLHKLHNRGRIYISKI